ncbi:MAG: hypothetical protein ACP5GZ_07955 [Vulcanisaeta sp.]|jgi:hypothetical protein|uniref:hypothetical protein n=1 Tax=Vulcanisaeta sp. TaxID=2020871 RepID=UPI003D095961
MEPKKKFQKDIKDLISRKELLKTLAAMSAIALLPTPILALATTPNPQNYLGLEINTKIKDVKLIDNDLVFVDSVITVYKDGREVNNGEVKAYVLRTAPSMIISPALIIISDVNDTIGIAVGYEKYVTARLSPNAPDRVVINELIKESSNMGMNDVIRVLDIISSKMNSVNIAS